MKNFTLAVLLSIATSSFAGTISAAREESAKWISVETADNTTHILEKRVGAEVVTCYNTGTRVDRAPSTSVIDDFCNNRAIGQFVANGHTLYSRYDYGSFTIFVSGSAINGCSFTIDGNCNRLLRLPLDGCNTSGENGKQGGYETDLCGQWRFDPGSNGSDF
ncbi:hypothetical protein NLJ89_g6591 [Agrocybe chaxingu]|uniref:Uncharacterized protein n=1 Tax=Agrocybe chaxingu TaxID=84603 RepID=A0A9W8MUH4_9AGAR|nr:hypothetical protein NLJ89_g6591 [Agrocybe chaxingu]